MLAIHWSPVKNTKNILKNGITKTKNGLYCFPLTGKKNIDQWWANYFRRKDNMQYNGFVFRIEKEDMPACFSLCHGKTASDKFKMEIKDLKELQLRYREKIIEIIGERKIKYDFSKTEEFSEKAKENLIRYPKIFSSINDPILLESVYLECIESQIIDENVPINDIFFKTGKAEIQNNQDKLNESLKETKLLEDAFSFWQIILSRSISPNRIINVVSNRNEYGKILHKAKKYKYIYD